LAKGKRYFTPLTFNLVAVIWIVGFLPLAVAFVSNVGTDSGNENWQNMTKEHIDLKYGEGNSPVFGDPAYCGTAFNCTGVPIAWDSNGVDRTKVYQYNNPDLDDFDIDCIYIRNGVCDGSYDPSLNQANDEFRNPFLDVRDCDTEGFFFQGQWVSLTQELQYNCQFVDEDWYYVDTIVGLQKFNMQYDRSNFYRGQDTHFALNTYGTSANITDDTYIGDSGDTFSIRLNELIMNQLPAREMVDQMRFTIFDYPDAPLATPADHNCDTYSGWKDLEISTTITMEFEGERNKLSTTYITETDNKFYIEAQPLYFSAGCYIGYEVIVDFNGFDTREMYNFVNGGRWNESSMIVEFEFERADGLPLGGTNIGFNGIDDFAFAIDYVQIDAQEVEFATNAGLLGMGGANIVLAMASTPYWDPFKNFFKGRL
jgi:hypothetical protein